MTTLDLLPPHASAIIINILSKNSHHKRMMEMGLIPGAKVRVAFHAPFGGSIAVECRGTLIAMRNEDAHCIEVQRL